MDPSSVNVLSEKKNAKCSSVLLPGLVHFFLERTLKVVNFEKVFRGRRYPPKNKQKHVAY